METELPAQMSPLSVSSGIPKWERRNIMIFRSGFGYQPFRKNHTVEILLASKSNKLQMAKGLMGSTQDQCSFLGK